MKKPMKKSRKTILAVLLVLLLLALCFACVGLYAKKELGKPKFRMPPEPAQSSVTALPTDAAEAAAYVSRLYTAATTADDVEISVHTDVETGDGITTPFAGADQDTVSFIYSRAGGQIAALYPNVSNVRTTVASDVPALPLQSGALSVEASQGDRDGKDTSDLYYHILLTVDPAAVDPAAMLQSDVYRGIAEILTPALTIDDADITVQQVTVKAVIDRVTDQLLDVDVTRTLQVHAAVTLTDAYASLLPEKTADVTLPYKAIEHIRFAHYGARFAQRAMAVKPGDMKALPAVVTVNAEATKQDYSLTFDVSHPDTMTIDADGVMTVLQPCDTPVTVTMTLQYDGHTYTDAMTVYITELEVESDV